MSTAAAAAAAAAPAAEMMADAKKVGGVPTSLPTSRLPEIWEKFHQKLRSIDTLENRLDEHVKRYRRRVTNALEQMPNYRRSHLRLFVTHKYDKGVEPKAATPMVTEDSTVSTPLPHNQWTLVVEGKLLVGLLDHASAQRVDKVGAFVRKGINDKQDAFPADKESADFRSSTVLPAPPTDPAADGEGGGSSRADRNKYRSVGDIEEDPVEPTLFAHAFDKMIVSFQTVWQPETPPQSASGLTPPKKSRKRKQQEVVQGPVAINPKHLKSSPRTNITWTKKHSSDAHAFYVKYAHLEAPDSMKFHSVAATVTLHSTRMEALYKPSSAMAEAFFPKHAPVGGGIRRRSGEETPTDDVATIPLDNEIQTPSLLTLNEIILALYQYITDKQLQDETDRSLIVCDKTLSNLLECESLSFGDLRSTLLSKNLIIPLESEDEPVVLKYIMTEPTVSPQELPAKGHVLESPPEGHHHQCLSFDMDVHLPSFFHWRAREIMRRIKRREFEYTSSRTKARYMLVASRGNEDLVKAQIGECSSGQGYYEDNIPIFLALAKAAPSGSEARLTAQADAKTCALMGRLDECTRQAQAAWELVDACKDLVSNKGGSE